MNERLSPASFEYYGNLKRRILNLGLDGIPSVPAVGRSHFSSNYPIVDKHVHPGCVEILYCADGNLYFDCEDEEYILMPGELLVVHPDVYHRLSVVPKKMFFYWLFFRLELEEGPLFKQPDDESALLHDNLTSIPVKVFRASPRVHSAFQHLFEIYDTMEKGPFRSLSLRSIVLDLLLSVIGSAHCASFSKRYPEVEKVVLQIKGSPEKEFDWELIVRKCNLSKPLFISRFKESTGLPPHAFVIFCRMKKARAMLKNKSCSVIDIAYALGFSSSQHFAMQFKRQFGMTPTQWRKSK